jgi:transposase
MATVDFSAGVKHSEISPKRMAARSMSHPYRRYTEEERWQAEQMCREGHTLVEVAAATGMDPSTVSDLHHKVAAHHTVADLPRSGRPHKLEGAALHHAKVSAELGHYKNYTDAAREVNDETGVKICPTTMARTLHREGVVLKRQPRARQITLKQRRARLKFAQVHLNADLTDFISLDETPLHRQEKGRQKFVFGHVKHALPASAYAQDLPYKGGKINLWAAVGRTGVLAWRTFRPNLTASLYQELLNDELLPAAHAHYGAGQWKMQHDNARPHTAKSMKKWLADASADHHFTVMEWPVNSPDLSPSENFWSQLKTWLSDKPPAQSMDALEARVADGIAYFNAERKEMFKNYFDSMHTRLKDIIKAKGGHIGY